MLRSACVIGLSVVIAACSRGKDPTSPPPRPVSARYGVQKVGDRILLEGVITSAMAAEFRQQLTPSVTTVIVRSGGGDTASAIEIARALHSRKLRLVVAGACMSACAQFLFPAAQERLILPDSLVVFHNTRSSIARLAADHATHDSADFQRAVRSDASLEQSFYAELGLPRAFLYEPQLQVRTACVEFLRNAQGSVQDLGYRSEFQGWIPRRSFMSSIGLVFQGFWPDNLDELARAFHAEFRTDRSFHILFGGPDHLMSAEQMNAEFKEIRTC